MTRSLRIDELIEDQTRQALHKQRQKGRFKLKSGPGRPEELHSNEKRGKSIQRAMEHSSSLPHINSTPSSREDRRKAPKSNGTMPNIKFLEKDIALSNEILDRKIAAAYKELSKLSDQYNTLKHQNEVKDKQVKELQDELMFLRKEDDVQQTSSALSKQIKTHESKLQKLEAEWDYITSYRETLMMMKQRLVDEKTPHAKILKAFENALKVQFGENNEIKLMARQVLQAKEIEEKELERRKQELETDKRVWATKLKEGEQLAQKREDMKKWFDERKEVSESKKSAQNFVVSKIIENHVSSNINSLKEDIAQYQMIFEKMEIVTGFGMNEPEEVANKCNGRKEQAEAAQKQEHELCQRIEYLTKEKKQLESELDGLKLMGPGTTEFNREMMDNLTSKHSQFREKEKTLKAACAKHEFALVEIDQTLNNLLRKLARIKIDSTQEHGVTERTDTISHKLESIYSKISRILTEFSQVGIPVPSFGECSVDDFSMKEVQKDSNIRVSVRMNVGEGASTLNMNPPKKGWFHTYHGEGSETQNIEDNGNFDEMEDERRAIKTSSQNILSKSLRPP